VHGVTCVEFPVTIKFYFNIGGQLTRLENRFTLTDNCPGSSFLGFRGCVESFGFFPYAKMAVLGSIHTGASRSVVLQISNKYGSLSRNKFLMESVTT
jgi:hypothetical protein